MLASDSQSMPSRRRLNVKFHINEDTHRVNNTTSYPNYRPLLLYLELNFSNFDHSFRKYTITSTKTYFHGEFNDTNLILYMLVHFSKKKVAKVREV